jgi:release factor glutamine methyltransferase
MNNFVKKCGANRATVASCSLKYKNAQFFFAIKSMKSSKSLFDNLLKQITVYERQEAKEIVFWLMEFYLNLKKIDVLSDKFTDNQVVIDWKSIIERLNTHEPIQYILGETAFYGRKFLVNDSVLIPRPETEELVKLIVDEQKKHQSPIINNQFQILDIGTGSGCIAISLAKELPDFQVFAYDISEKALETAQKNAELNNTKVIFEKKDILKYPTSNIQHPTFDIIVSNPPYVTKQEIKRMQKNVLNFEPHLALFVEDTEPLIFYEAIANFAFNNLTTNGLVAVEINEALAYETANVFIKKGFSKVEIIKDIHQKNRFVSAVLYKKDEK